MSWQEEEGPGALDAELRSVLGGSAEHFDYDALIAGTKVRARRMRRRRAVAQGATAAVLVPTLVGTGFLVSSSLQGGDRVTPAAPSTDQVQTTTQDDSGRTSAPVAVQDGPPYQDPELLPAATDEEPNPDFPNRWAIPDVRPTGIDLLDALGSPRLAFSYPKTMPLPGMVAADEGVEPHSGRLWMFHDGTNDFEQVTVEIAVTAWDHSTQVMDALRTGEPLTVARWDGGPQPRPWPAHHDDDHLLVDMPRVAWPQVGALVRRGDYIVGVTVRAQTEEGAAAAAGQIAERAAANLVFLDPEHAQD